MILFYLKFETVLLACRSDVVLAMDLVMWPVTITANTGASIVPGAMVMGEDSKWIHYEPKSAQSDLRQTSIYPIT